MCLKDFLLSFLYLEFLVKYSQLTNVLFSKRQFSKNTFSKQTFSKVQFLKLLFLKMSLTSFDKNLDSTKRVLEKSTLFNEQLLNCVPKALEDFMSL